MATHAYQCEEQNCHVFPLLVFLFNELHRPSNELLIPSFRSTQSNAHSVTAELLAHQWLSVQLSLEKPTKPHLCTATEQIPFSLRTSLLHDPMFLKLFSYSHTWNQVVNIFRGYLVKYVHKSVNMGFSLAF